MAAVGDKRAHKGHRCSMGGRTLPLLLFWELLLLVAFFQAPGGLLQDIGIGLDLTGDDVPADCCGDGGT